MSTGVGHAAQYSNEARAPPTQFSGVIQRAKSCRCRLGEQRNVGRRCPAHSFDTYSGNSSDALTVPYSTAGKFQSGCRIHRGIYGSPPAFL